MSYERQTIQISLEGKMTEHLFMALYAGLTMIQRAEDSQAKGGMFSLVGAEAYCFIEDLKAKFPKEMKEAELDTRHYYPWLFGKTPATTSDLEFEEGNG